MIYQLNKKIFRNLEPVLLQGQNLTGQQLQIVNCKIRISESNNAQMSVLRRSKLTKFFTTLVYTKRTSWKLKLPQKRLLFWIMSPDSQSKNSQLMSLLHSVIVCQMHLNRKRTFYRSVGEKNGFKIPCFHAFKSKKLETCGWRCWHFPTTLGSRIFI